MKMKFIRLGIVATLLSARAGMAEEFTCWDQSFTYNRVRVSTTTSGTEFSVAGAALGAFYIPGLGDDVGLSPGKYATFYFRSEPGSCAPSGNHLHCAIGSNTELRTAPLFHVHTFNNLGELQSVFSTTKLDQIAVDWNKSTEVFTVQLIRDGKTYELKIVQCELEKNGSIPELQFPQEIRDFLSRK